MVFSVIRKWKWIISAVLCFILLETLPATFIEEYYSAAFFLGVRKLLDNTFGRLPFPSYYLFAGLMAILILKWILHFFREKPQPFLQRIFKVLSFAGFMVTLFFVLWGFNYGRVPLEDKLKLEVHPISKDELINETDTVIQHLLFIRNTISTDTNPIPQIVFINNIEENSKTALLAALKDLNYPNSTNVRGRFLLEDMFLVFNVGGQYMPFVGEGNVDDAVYYSKKPFYLMHEMAHGNGFTEEAACNFLAYVSCTRSKNLSLQYSGELNYLLYLLAELKYREEEKYNNKLDALPAVIRKDLEEIRRYNKQHTFRTGFIGDWINNRYLKILGIEEGTKNYDKMILLVYAWKCKTGR